MRHLTFLTAAFLVGALPALAQLADTSSPTLGKAVRSAPVVQTEKPSALQALGSDATHAKDTTVAPQHDATHVQGAMSDDVRTTAPETMPEQVRDKRHGLNNTGLKRGDLPRTVDGSAPPTLSARDYGSDATALTEGTDTNPKHGLAGARVVTQGETAQDKPEAPDAKTGLGTGLKPSDMPVVGAANQPEPDCPEGQVALPLQSGWRCTAPEQPCPEGKHPVRGMNGIECAADDEHAEHHVDPKATLIPTP